MAIADDRHSRAAADRSERFGQRVVTSRGNSMSRPMSVVIDNSAKPGRGKSACRIDEQVVRDEVQLVKPSSLPVRKPN